MEKNVDQVKGGRVQGCRSSFFGCSGGPSPPKVQEPVEPESQCADRPVRLVRPRVRERRAPEVVQEQVGQRGVPVQVRVLQNGAPVTRKGGYKNQTRVQ